MKIISWNINRIRSKSMNLLENKQFNNESPLGKLIEEHKPDIVCFSEIRCQQEHTKMFDCLPFKYKHYHCCNPTYKKGDIQVYHYYLIFQLVYISIYMII